MYQQIILIGNCGNAPEMRYTQNGTPVTNLRIAVNKQWTDQQGERQEKTTWFNVTFWKRQAEIVAEYVTSGQLIFVVGEIEDAKPYTDREGSLRCNNEVSAQLIKFLSGRGKSGQPEFSESPPAGSKRPSKPAPAPSEDEIPF